MTQKVQFGGNPNHFFLFNTLSFRRSHYMQFSSDGLLSTEDAHFEVFNSTNVAYFTPES